MKTQIIVLLIMALSLNVMGEGNIFLTKFDRNAIIVNRGEWKSKTVNVVITDENGFTVFTQKLSKKVDLIKYNIDELPNGNYSMEIFDDLRIVRKEFSIKNDQLLLSDKYELMYKPVVKISKNMVDVQMLAMNKEAQITLTDKEGNVLHNEKVTSTTVSRRMDVSILPSGNYTVTVEVGDRYFYHEFTK